MFEGYIAQTENATLFISQDGLYNVYFGKDHIHSVQHLQKEHNRIVGIRGECYFYDTDHHSLTILDEHVSVEELV